MLNEPTDMIDLPTVKNIYSLTALTPKSSRLSLEENYGNSRISMSNNLSQKIDLSTDEYCSSNLIKTKYTRLNLEETDKFLLIDLTNHSLGSQLKKFNNLINLQFSSTLVRRPNFQFKQLIQTLDSLNQSELLRKINAFKKFIVFDNISKWNNCLISTFMLIKKLIVFIKELDEDSNIYFLEIDSRQWLDNEKLNSNHGKKTNLKLNIPLPSFRNVYLNDSLSFANSFKKNNLSYSPDSVKKYFKFSTPQNKPKHVPVWLLKFNSNDENYQLLFYISEKFNILEKLELKRLQNCLHNDVDNKDGHHIKVKEEDFYHFDNFKKLDHLNNLDYNSDNNTHIENDINLVGWLKDSSDNDFNSFDEVETKMNNYLMTHGIQSFTKNRYSNILPYEHSRVKLEPSPAAFDNTINITTDLISNVVNITKTSNKLDNSNITMKRRNSYFNQEENGMNVKSIIGCSGQEPFSDYINANYLKLPQINPNFNYIATQAPLLCTLDDFWKVIISNKVKIIISLISDDELYLKKWDIYWNNGTLNKFQIEVNNVLENVCDIQGCILRIFNVRKLSNNSLSLKKIKAEESLDNEIFTVYQLQYTKWIDSCGIVMEDFLKLYRIKNWLIYNSEEFIKQLNSDKKQHLVYTTPSGFMNPSFSDPPILVHCSAGCGRTGVFITLDFLLNVLEDETNRSNRIDVWNVSVDLIFVIVNELRKQRISMVQNLTQYLTCYESILEYFSIQENIDKRILDPV